MTESAIFELPEFDTGQYNDCELLLSDGDATLTIEIAGLGKTTIKLRRVRWHQFTALPNCSPKMIQGAYFRLIEDRDSSEARRFMQQDQASSKAYSGLNYYRIFLDETGCHEFFAESAKIC